MKKPFFLGLTFIYFVLMTTFTAGCLNLTISGSTPSPATSASSKSTSTPAPIAKPAIASKTYTNSTLGFSCEYPENWDLEEGLVGTIVMFAGPLSTENNYMTNINIVKAELPKKYTVEDYSRLGELQLKKNQNDYIKLQEYNATISGLPAIIRTFTATIKNYQLKDIQAYFIKEKTAYIITYDVAKDFHDKYTEYLNLVMSTFEFN